MTEILHTTGADIVNDVSAGVYDPLMLPTVGELGVPYVAMHMRGDPQTMQQPHHLLYRTSSDTSSPRAVASPADSTTSPSSSSASVTTSFTASTREERDNEVVTVVARELQHRLTEIDRHIPRWLQMVDPGIGFAKGYDENLALLQPRNLRRFKELLGDRFMVVGFSRKKFLSRVLEESVTQRRQVRYELDTDAPVDQAESLTGGVGGEGGEQVASPASIEERDLASAAGCTAALLGGTDVVRVHNVAYTRIACDTFQAFQSFK